MCQFQQQCLGWSLSAAVNECSVSKVIGDKTREEKKQSKCYHSLGLTTHSLGANIAQTFRNLAEAWFVKMAPALFVRSEEGLCPDIPLPSGSQV